jgi:hypothetical protein
VKDVKKTPRHTGLYFSANQSNSWLLGLSSVFIKKYFGNHQARTRNRLHPPPKRDLWKNSEVLGPKSHPS